MRCVAQHGFPALSAGQLRADHGGCEKCGLRLLLDGKLPVTPRRAMHPGQIGYFPEGTFYGPQADDGTGWTIMIVQFGGAGGEGFLSADEALAAKNSLAREGDFDGGVFRR